MEYDIKTNAIKTTLIAIPIAVMLLAGFLIGFAWRGNDVSGSVLAEKEKLNTCQQAVIADAQKISADSVKGKEAEVYQWAANRLNDCILKAISTTTETVK
jgi:hypothetical protein